MPWRCSPTRTATQLTSSTSIRRTHNKGSIRDWRYNNLYVEADDDYRHLKWLAMMERRLLVAAELLNPADSVLIVIIDELEVHRLGLLLEQLFPEARVQMADFITTPKPKGGVHQRRIQAGRGVHLLHGSSHPARLTLAREWPPSPKAALADALIQMTRHLTRHRARIRSSSTMRNRR